MKLSHPALNALLAAALLGTSLGAMAHGDEDHSKKAAGAVKKEQKDWGIAGDARAVKRTIVVTMTDNMRFTPDNIEVKQGETVKFVIKNDGKMMHEMVIGTKKVLDEHAALMVKFPNMEHEEPYMTHVAQGKTGEMIWNFNRAGDFDFACLIAGHYQAGMVGKIKVAGTGRSDAHAPGHKH
ncbi:MAG: cupredoxin family protein [Pseudomonadota bacterium]